MAAIVFQPLLSLNRFVRRSRATAVIPLLDCLAALSPELERHHQLNIFPHSPTLHEPHRDHNDGVSIIALRVVNICKQQNFNCCLFAVCR